MNKFSDQLKKTGEFGLIEQVRHPIVAIAGLPGVSLHEIVVFEDETIGEAYMLHEDSVEVLVFSKKPLKTGMKVTRTGRFISVHVGYELLGSVIDPLGNPIANASTFKMPKEEREIDTPPPGMYTRIKINTPFFTGVSVVDMMVPLGRGQKELIIGDRKTGKTSFVLAAIKSQVQSGAIAIYAGIAKRKSDIRKIQQFIKDEKIADRVIVVASTSYDSSGIIYLTPFSAMAIAEYFRDKGEHVVVVLDDLSTHARFYREIALLAKRFPGRDSYPGDIFHMHARLLERAGNFKHEKGESSITALPVAEIVEGDLSGFIPTNLMGMTDGHIFFDNNIYFNGRRPAVNISLSVTRVGRQSQRALGKSINRELTAFLTLYDRIQNLSHFGAELTDTVKNTIRTGDIIYHFFNQKMGLVIPTSVQMVLFGLIWLNFLGEVKIETLAENIKNLKDSYSKNPEYLDKLSSTETFNEFLKKITENKDDLLKICTIKRK